MVKAKNLGRESIARSIIGSILIVFSFFISGVFWLGVGLIGAILVGSAFFKYRPRKGISAKGVKKRDR